MTAPATTETPVAPVTPETPPAPVETPETPAAPVTPETPETPAVQPVAVTEEPAAYTLTLPENTTADADLIERTTAIARSSGLSKEQAEQMLAFVAAETQTTTETRAQALADAQFAAHQPGGEKWAAQTKEWEAAALADPELGNGDATVLQDKQAKAQKVLTTFFGEGVYQFLHTSGLGSDPEILRGLVRLEKAMGEGSFVSGAPAKGPGADKFTDPLTGIYSENRKRINSHE
jgi:hypothetical protein